MSSPSQKKIAIVTTTIYVPKALREYMKNVKEYNREGEVFFVVTGDKKTPPEAQTFCEEISKEFGVECIFQTVDNQISWLERFPELRDEIPWNSIQRRNLAILHAYERGAVVIITIDDDNFAIPGQDFVGDHAAPLLGSAAAGCVETLASSTRWINVCQYLEDRRGFEFYPRGYPMQQRWPRDPLVVQRRGAEQRPVVVNGGLWLGDPDVDAVTRLCNDIDAVRYTREGSLSLARGTWCPFNSQNTALHRDVIPSYCLSPNVGRYDDIWGGYVTMAVAHHLDHAVAFGHPLVRQERNPHNYFKDHEAEKVGLEYTDTFVRWLQEVPLTGRDYRSCTEQLLAGLEVRLSGGDVPEPLAAHVRGLVKSYRAWLAALARLDS